MDIDCSPNRISIEREFFGRHPNEDCFPSGGPDCGVDWDFYKVRICRSEGDCKDDVIQSLRKMSLPNANGNRSRVNLASLGDKSSTIQCVGGKRLNTK